MKPIIPGKSENLISLAKRCDAFYLCPKEASVRRGPLVVYVGKDERGKNYVGDLYFNFRKIESHIEVVKEFASIASQKLEIQNLSHSFDTICGIPEGGRTLAQTLADIMQKRFTYPTKLPLPVQEGEKQEYTWDLSQFEFEKGERVALVEDVFNNFQNTDNTLNEIAKAGAVVTLLVGAFNRSSKYSDAYIPKAGAFAGKKVPIVASICEPYPEYQQDDPEVAEDVAAGNIEFQVKKNWSRLVTLMEKYK